MSVLIQRIHFIRALKYKPYALLWIGQTISSLGDGAYLTALAWLILVLTGSATAMGIVVTAGTIPRILFLLLGGVAADRFSRRAVMLWSDLGRAFVVLLITFLAWSHLLQLWHLVVLSFFFGFVDGFFIPAYQSIPPQLVPKEDLPSANALNELTQHFSLLLGPLLGAAGVALFGPALAFGFDGLTFLASAVCLFALRLAPVESVLALEGGSGALKPAPALEADTGDTPAPAGGMRGVLLEMREGLSYIMSSTWLWVTIVLSALGNIFFTPMVVALPKLVHDVYGTGVWLLGALATASAIGSILAVLIVGQAKRIRWRGIKANLMMVGSGLAMVVMGLPFSRALAPFIACPANLVVGFGAGFFNVIWFIVLQQMVPEDKLGRVSSIDMMGSICLTPVGLALGGIVTDRIGPQPVLIGSGLITVLLALIALSVRGVRALD